MANEIQEAVKHLHNSIASCQENRSASLVQGISQTLLTLGSVASCAKARKVKETVLTAIAAIGDTLKEVSKFQRCLEEAEYHSNCARIHEESHARIEWFYTKDRMIEAIDLDVALGNLAIAQDKVKQSKQHIIKVLCTITKTLESASQTSQ